MIEESAAIKKVVGPVSAGNTARAAVPVRYMLERQDWKGAAQLQPLGTPFLPAEAITHFARALGAARSDDFDAAQADIAKLKELREGLEKASQSYWAEQVEVQILGAQAWVAYGQGNKDEALKFMNAAADLEDGSAKHVATENRLYPMRELLADMQMQQGEPAAALKTYQTSMRATPMRLRGFYGAAKAAEAVGDKKERQRISASLRASPALLTATEPKCAKCGSTSPASSSQARTPPADVRPAPLSCRNSATMRFAKLTAATLITVGLTLAPRIGIADPTDDDTAEAQLDPDYAAGKKAIEAKNWSGAIKSLSSAALRDPRNANIRQ